MTPAKRKHSTQLTLPAIANLSKGDNASGRSASVTPTTIGGWTMKIVYARSDKARQIGPGRLQRILILVAQRHLQRVDGLARGDAIGLRQERRVRRRRGVDVERGAVGAERLHRRVKLIRDTGRRSPRDRDVRERRDAVRRLRAGRAEQRRSVRGDGERDVEAGRRDGVVVVVGDADRDGGGKASSRDDGVGL